MILFLFTGVFIGTKQTKQLCKYHVICLGNVPCLLSLFYVICNESACVKKKKNVEVYRWIVLQETQQSR